MKGLGTAMGASLKKLRSAMQAAERRAAADECAAAQDERGRGLRRLLRGLQLVLLSVSWGGLAGLVWYHAEIARGPLEGWPRNLAEVIGLPAETAPPLRLSKLVAPPEATAIEVSFAPGSDRLSRDAKRRLANFGLALKGPAYRDRRIRVIGHADSAGPADFNLALSQRRAARVRDFLVRESGLSPARLLAVGRGEAAPLDPSRPDTPANRRVQIVLEAGPASWGSARSAQGRAVQ